VRLLTKERCQLSPAGLGDGDPLLELGLGDVGELLGKMALLLSNADVL